MGDANELDHLCWGYVWVMAANLLLSMPFYGQGEYGTVFWTNYDLRREHFFVLCSLAINILHLQ